MTIKLELKKWVAQQKKPKASTKHKKKRVRKEDNFSLRDIENLMGSRRDTYGRRKGRVVSKRR